MADTPEFQPESLHSKFMERKKKKKKLKGLILSMSVKTPERLLGMGQCSSAWS